MAEREGFEPSVLVKAHTLSRRDPSATRASLHNKAIKPARLLGRKKLQVVTLVFVRIKIGKRFKNPARRDDLVALGNTHLELLYL